MRGRIWIPVAMFAGGGALIAWAIAIGEAEVSLFLIFPVFSGSSGLFLLGTMLIVLSFIVGFISLAMGQAELQLSNQWRKDATDTRTTNILPKKEFGGVVLIGPVPIAFGSTRALAILMLVVGIVTAIILLGILAALA